MTLPKPLRRLASIVAAAALLAAASCAHKSGGPAAPAGTATVSGIVYGLTGGGAPMQGVAVSSAPSSGAGDNTDIVGQFSIRIPAGSVVAVTALKSGFASHSQAVALANGSLQTLTFSLIPIAGGAFLNVSAGGKVSDPTNKAAITLPAGFASGITTVLISLTGLDPTTVQSLALPGTHLGATALGSAEFIQPIAAAEVEASDGVGTEYALAANTTLELPIPVAFRALPALGAGQAVPCFHYDVPSGRWKQFGTGTVGTSSVAAVPAVIVTVPPGPAGWFAAALTSSGSASVQGVVTSGGLPVAGADVQAYPGGTARTGAGGGYVVGAPPGSPIQVVATRVSSGTVTPGSVTVTTGALGTTTVAPNLALQSAPGALTYTIRAQLVRGRDFLFASGTRRDEAVVRILANTTPSPTPVQGAVVQIRNTAVWTTLPALNPAVYGAGSYGILNGLANGSLTLVPDSTYALRVDLDANGTFEATASVRMPGDPVIVAPTNSAVMDSAFAAVWTDAATGMPGYSASYIGSFESQGFGTFPARFLVASPALTKFVGDGVPDVAHHLPNNPLFLDTYVFRLWAFNGPIQYALPDTTLFTTPNVTGTNVTGWFSAFTQADSVTFSSRGINGTRPAGLRRDRGPTALAGRPR